MVTEKHVGLDTPYSIAKHGKAIAAAGKSFVIRYLSPNTHNFPNKRLTPIEVTEAATAGLWLGSVWEAMGSAAEMNAATGDAHGKAAVATAQRVKQPKGSGLYFAVDYDAPTSDHAGIAGYFTRVRPSVIPAGFLVGAYGSEDVIDMLLELGLIHFGWKAGSSGWSGANRPTKAAIIQTSAGNNTVGGLSCDLDEIDGSLSAAGLWQP